MSLLALNSWAGGYISVQDLETTTQVRGSSYRQRSGGGVDPSGWNSENAASQIHEVLTSGKKSKVVRTNYDFRLKTIFYPGPWPADEYIDFGLGRVKQTSAVARDLLLKAIVENNSDGSVHLKVSFAQDIQRDQYKNSYNNSRSFPRRSSSGSYSMRFINSSISGKIHLAYEVPKDVWAVRVRRGDYLGDFKEKFSNGQFINTLNGVKDEGLPKTDVVLLVKPGTKIYQIFNFDKYVPGKNLRGAFAIYFRPLTFSDLKDISTAELVTTLQSKIIIGKEYSDDEIDEMFSLVMALFTQNRKSEILNILSDYQLNEFLYSLYELANNSQANSNMFNLKAMSSVLSYQLAMAYLSEFKTFCYSADQNKTLDYVLSIFVHNVYIVGSPGVSDVEKIRQYFVDDAQVEKLRAEIDACSGVGL